MYASFCGCVRVCVFARTHTSATWRLWLHIHGQNDKLNIEKEDSQTKELNQNFPDVEIFKHKILKW